MKYIQPVTFEGDPQKEIKDFRPKAVAPDPKGLSAQEYVNESPPGKTLSSTGGLSQNTEEHSIQLVSPSQLENTLRDVWENDANVEKDETGDIQS